MEKTHKIRTSFKTLASKKVAKWCLKKFQSNDKLSQKVMSFSITKNEKHSPKQVVPITYTLEKRLFAAPLLKVCGSFLVRKRVTYLGLFESILHF